MLHRKRVCVCVCVCERERERERERESAERERERITHILRRNTATCLAEGRRLWKLLGRIIFFVFCAPGLWEFFFFSSF